MEASSWMITFEIYEKDCTLTKTNLFAYWDGCKYVLVQVVPINDTQSEMTIVGRFKSIDQIQEWIKITNGWIGKKQK